MIHIDLYRKNWITQGAVSTIGWAEWMGKSYTGEAFHQLVLSSIRRKEHTLSQLATGLNGNYAIVIQSKSSVFLISDHIRSYPLLYLKEKGHIYITDNLLASFEKYGLNPEVDIRKAEVFLTAGLTLEDSTLYKEVYALQAAEIVRINDQETEKKRYFTYASEFDPKKKLVVTEEVEKQNALFTRLFRRMRESAPEVRNWIVPLSGGHDSRMVLNQMHKLGIKNLICYSYGYPGNKQSRLSQQIAEALGYAWHFVEYTPEKWQALRESPDFDRYFDFAFNGVSDPHIQDLLAVSELKKQKILQPGDIFVPGHTFDFLTGAYCFDGIEKLRSKQQIYTYLAPYFNQWEATKRSDVVLEELSTMIKHFQQSPRYFPEYFHWQERHAKFIQNSVRVYEYFGFDWRTPLWDKELMVYWQQIPVEIKKYRRFLYACEKNGLYEEPLRSIAFDLEMRPVGTKSKLIASLPDAWKRKLIYRTRKETPRSDDALYMVYAAGSPRFPEGMPYDKLPNKLRRYLKPYVKRPLHWFPDNDNNTLYAIRNVRF
ncbi:asparagine synthase (glutamine-hydrolyzing) [Parabacteroides sp. PFB2-12]|uniref:asparagine synthetase B family protein n=1 Tax=unclassified Parabacteroides TaxID=2649774 RepID=UPI00247656E2|nr:MULTISPECIES: asparagine synthetase B family protein [unclassified Parabacteroides]MDH6342492.1 asparagine synthase (glutamine-hydrolyzing) [Parabacteroides sp. PM6-13]MDH6390144.1 asparagine synthase (glutamine-hydrolyzing) [Parabacteroides sp. PFB2-12]